MVGNYLGVVYKLNMIHSLDAKLGIKAFLNL